MFSKSLEHTLNNAFLHARERRHEFITIEHLLLALLDNADASRILLACGANLDRLRAGLGIFIEETTPHVPLNVDRDVQPTLSFQRVLQRAICQAQAAGSVEVSGGHLLIALYSEPESQAVYFLTQENVSRADVVSLVSRGHFREIGFNNPRLNQEQLGYESSTSQDHQPDEALIEIYADNLNEKASRGSFDPLIGRQEELERVIQVLCRRGKNNPLLIGEAGVGKTAIAEGLAQRIIQKKVPKLLQNCVIYSIDLGVMLAGTKYRGDFEKRFKSVLKALSQERGAIVFIDEIHNLVGAGSATGGTMDAANLIKPLLSSGELRCMGATTYAEYRNFIVKDHALLRRFQKIDVEEPTQEETLEILKGLKLRFERHHDVIYMEESLTRAIELSVRYLSDRHLPDKAIDVIDEAGAFQRLQPQSERKHMITPAEIEEVVAKIARVPIQTVSSSDRRMMRTLERKLRHTVYGQDAAIHTLVNAVTLSRAGLRDVNKPIGSFLLAGPTGVGKTEVTRQLAQSLGVELIRFDMSEYMERHAVARLIGSPPGYVGFEQGGLLTEAINKHPYSVLLLDEIEKAHPDIFNILLQVMDYGKLTDNNGRKADFRHVVLVMTTNAGADRMEKESIGFVSEKHSSECVDAIKRMFAPEFRNRLDAIVTFGYLEEDVVQRVVDKFIHELRHQLREKDVKLLVSQEAREWLAREGYDRHMGARPMARLIQEQLKLPLASELLYGKLSHGHGEVRVTVEDNVLRVKVKSTQSSTVFA